MRPSFSMLLGLTATMTAALSGLTPRMALACGGTFCDSGVIPGQPVPPMAKPPMPVDQSGENIVFSFDGTTVEAQVQIQYTGNPSRFAWVVPVQSKPEVTAGSQALFTNLLRATVPTYAITGTADVCPATPGGSPSSSSFGCGSAATVSSDSAGFAPGQSGGGGRQFIPGKDGGVEVVEDKTVGSFEVAVLKGGTVDEVTQWLTTNGFVVNSDAGPILQDYLSKGYLFVAIKLQAGAGLDAIHPIVFRYQGSTPCVPLRLTSIAATSDMGVRAFFLGNGRVVPTNYKHVVLNEARQDWPNLVPDYKADITNAVDGAIANGHAFVTEYAGPSSIVPTKGILSPEWNTGAFRGLTPAQAVAQLEFQGLLSCVSGSCKSSHPLVFSLLERFIPVPAGGSAGAYYSCVSCLPTGQEKGSTWAAQAFADAVDQLIVQPGQRASDLLASSPYLTRLYTTISPPEMTEDPEFAEHDELLPVSQTHQATQRQLCTNGQTMLLPDNREVALTPTSSWPTFDSMTFVERIEDYSNPAQVVVLANNKVQIDEQVAAWNATQGFPAPPAPTKFQPASDQGCGCHLRPRQGTTGMMVGALGVLWGLRRVRRVRRVRRAPRRG